MNRSIKLLLALLCAALLFLSPGFGALADQESGKEAISGICAEETVQLAAQTDAETAE